LEPCDRGLGEGLRGEVAQSLSSPEIERSAVRRRGRFMVATAGRIRGVASQKLEAAEDEPVWREPDHIPGGTRLHERARIPAGALGIEQLPEVRDLGVDLRQ